MVPILLLLMVIFFVLTLALAALVLDFVLLYPSADVVIRAGGESRLKRVGGIVLRLGIVGSISMALYFSISHLLESEFESSSHKKEYIMIDTVLESDHYERNFLLPQGSLIRYSTEKDPSLREPFELSDLRRARFPYPVNIIGIQAAAIDYSEWTIELATDQMIGPIYYENINRELFDDRWIIDPSVNTLHCKKGQIAHFEKTYDRGYDSPWVRDEEEGYLSAPDWVFLGCTHDVPIHIDIPHHPIPKEESLIEESDNWPEAYYYALRRHYELDSKSSDEDYQKAFDLFMEATAEGEATTDWYIGDYYLKGKGVEQSAKEASRWFLKAAKKNSTDGMVSLALLYLEGDGVEQDYHQAFSLLHEAEALNSSDAHYYLGKLYSEGVGVEINYPLAINYFAKSGSRNSTQLERSIGKKWLAYQALLYGGRLHEEGKLGEQNRGRARYWYQKACNLNLDKECEIISEYEQRIAHAIEEVEDGI